MGSSDEAPRVVAWMERHQVALYLSALAAGAAVGLAAPAARGALEAAITPVLAALLYATFLGVPFTRLRAAFADARFMAALLVVNFLVVPAVVLPLSRLVADEPGLLVGTLLVLLAPCVDYVMVFTRLAGGAWSRTLAASPVLMVVQALVLPLWIALATGSPGSHGGGISWWPFAQAFLVMIALPLGLSVLTQRATEGPTAMARCSKAVATTATSLMVPLMMATLGLVVASQVPQVVSRPDVVARVVPLFVAFAVLMPVAGDVVGRLARQGRRERVALAFSATTRNSLVVLPLALALPDSMGIAPIVVVTQTLVELIVMVVGVRLLPRFIR